MALLERSRELDISYGGTSNACHGCGRAQHHFNVNRTRSGSGIRSGSLVSGMRSGSLGSEARSGSLVGSGIRSGSLAGSGIRSGSLAGSGIRNGSVQASGEGGDDTITMIMVVVLFLACNTLVSSVTSQLRSVLGPA